MGVNKVNLGEETLIDLTGVTVNSQNLLNGATAIGADGEPVEGAVTYAPLTTSLAVTEEGVSALDGTVGKVMNDKISEINSKLIDANFNTSAAGITWTKFPNGFIFGYGDKVLTTGTTNQSGSFPGYVGKGTVDISDIPFKKIKRVFGNSEGSTNYPTNIKSDCLIGGNTISLSVISDNSNQSWRFYYMIIGF